MSTWKNVASKVSQAAPLIGGILGGPAGMAIGSIIPLIASKFGIKPEEVTPDKLEQIIQQDSGALLKLKELEYENEADLRRFYLQMRSLELQDVSSARIRETDVVKATGTKDINLYILAYLFVSGFFISIILMLYLSLSGKLPEIMPEYIVFLLGSLFGTLTAGVGAVVQYFFGSSKGSSDKNKMLTNQKGL